jgi:hypothetical protein
VRLWVEEKSGTAINPVPANVVSTYTDPSGRKHYQLAGCTSTGGAKCAGDMTWTGTLPLGEYYFHCDQPDVTKICSGNPFCDYETENPPAPVTYACNGWMSCGGMDNQYLKVDATAPACFGPAPNYTMVSRLAEMLHLDLISVS